MREAAEADTTKVAWSASRRGEKFGPLLTYRFGGADECFGGMAMQ